MPGGRSNHSNNQSKSGGELHPLIAQAPWLAMGFAADLGGVTDERLLDLVRRGLQLAELRLDLGRAPIDSEGLDRALTRLEAAGLPALLTANRDGQRHDALLDVSALSRALALDLDLEALRRAPDAARRLLERARSCGVCAIVSFHDYRATPKRDQLAACVTEALACGADVIKIAALVNAPEDVAELRAILHSPPQPAAGRLIVIGMGEAGRETRWSFPKIGSLLTFASDGDLATAPGQVPLDELARHLTPP